MIGVLTHHWARADKVSEAQRCSIAMAQRKAKRLALLAARR